MSPGSWSRLVIPLKWLREGGADMKARSPPAYPFIRRVPMDLAISRIAPEPKPRKACRACVSSTGKGRPRRCWHAHSRSACARARMRAIRHHRSARGHYAARRLERALSFATCPSRPPLGELAGNPPQPAKHWAGVRDATAPARRASRVRGWNRPDATQSAEDCLYLDVHTPL